MKIKPNVEYTREQVASFRDDPELASVLLRGYVFTLTVGGNFMLVPWNQAAGGGHSGKDHGDFDAHSGGSSYGRPVEQVFDKKELPPIVKRTPQQRMDSLMSKVGTDLKLYLSAQRGKDVSGEDTRAFAAAHMQTADDKFEERQFKLVVRTDGDPYA